MSIPGFVAPRQRFLSPRGHGERPAETLFVTFLFNVVKCERNFRWETALQAPALKANTRIQLSLSTVRQPVRQGVKSNKAGVSTAVSACLYHLSDGEASWGWTLVAWDMFLHPFTSHPPLLSSRMPCLLQAPFVWAKWGWMHPFNFDFHFPLFAHWRGGWLHLCLPCVVPPFQ